MAKSKLHPGVRRVVESSSNYTCQESVQALDRYAIMRPIFDKIAAEYCAIITPSIVNEAPLELSGTAFNFF